MSQRRFRNYELQTGCGVEACLEVIGGKWKGLILYHLMQHGTLRFSQMQIVRKVYPVVPPKVEYTLSGEGQSLRELIQAMQAWGDGLLVRSKEKTARHNQTHAGG